jgi:hypothetical protein
MVRLQLISPQKGYLDVKDGTSFPLTYSAQDVRDISTKTSTFSKTIVLDGNANNNALLSYLFDINVVDGTFNLNKLQSVDVLEDGIIILEKAYLRLLSVNNLNGALEYECQVFESKADLFVQLGASELTDIDFSDLDHTLTTTNIANSFANTSGYKYILPYTDRNTFSLSEMKPAIFAKEYLTRMFARAGFTYEFKNTDIEDKVNKLLIPYNGSEFQVEQEAIDENTALVSRTTQNREYTSTSGSIPPLNNGLTKIIANTTVLDPSSLYDTSTGDYDVQLYTANDNGAYDINFKARFRVILKNATGSSAYLVNDAPFGTRYLSGSTRLTFTKTGSSTETSSLGVGAVPTFNIPTGYELVNGDTTIYDVQLDLNTSLLNCEPNDIIRAFLNATHDQVGSKWRNGTTTSDTLVNVTLEYKFDNIEIEIKPRLTNVGFNYPLNGNSFVPKKVKQSDFLKGVLTMFNLMAYPDEQEPTKIYFETRDSYYDSGNKYNWTDKIDVSKEQSIVFLPELLTKRSILTYKQDSDAANTTFLQATNEIYGQLEFIFDSEYLTGSDTRELLFSPTPIAQTPFNAYLPIINGYAPKNNIRVLYDGGLKNCATYNIYDYKTNGVSRTTYPLVHHFDDALNPTFDINFGICDYYFYKGVNVTNNNLFNTYYRRTYNQLNKGKMLTAYFKLNANDVRKVNLNDTIQVCNVIYNINKIIDYNANSNEPTKVELITVDDGLTTFKTKTPLNVGLDHAPTSMAMNKHMDDVYQTANIIYSDSAEVQGRGNVVEGSQVRVIGDSNYVSGERVEVLGNDNTVSGEGVQVVGDDKETSANNVLPYRSIVCFIEQFATETPTPFFFEGSELGVPLIKFSVGYYYFDFTSISGNIYLPNTIYNSPVIYQTVASDVTNIIYYISVYIEDANTVSILIKDNTDAFVDLSDFNNRLYLPEIRIYN